jgi:GDP-L-fucose synthase
VKLLITGAQGMVGRNLQENSGLSNYEILIPARKEMNLSSRESVHTFLKLHRPDFIIHAAGRVGGIQANIKHPVEFLVENIDINRNLIGTAYELGIKNLLNLGSSCMYPRDGENPLKESMVLQGELEPTNEGYALAKVMGQRLCTYVMKEDPKFNYKTLIPCNLYGRYDKFSPEHSHLVPAVVRKLHEAKLRGSAEVDIWGDGLARREFMYAGDLADCIIRCIENFEDLPELMNVGPGVDHTVNEYYAAVAEVIGYKGTFIHDLSKPVGMKRKLVSVEVLEKWGWKSKTSLSQGIAKAYEYFLSLPL